VPSSPGPPRLLHGQVSRTLEGGNRRTTPWWELLHDLSRSLWIWNLWPTPFQVSYLNAMSGLMYALSPEDDSPISVLTPLGFNSSINRRSSILDSRWDQSLLCLRPFVIWGPQVLCAPLLDVPRTQIFSFPSFWEVFCQYNPSPARTECRAPPSFSQTTNLRDCPGGPIKRARARNKNRYESLLPLASFCSDRSDLFTF